MKQNGSKMYFITETYLVLINRIKTNINKKSIMPRPIMSKIPTLPLQVEADWHTCNNYKLIVK